MQPKDGHKPVRMQSAERGDGLTYYEYVKIVRPGRVHGNSVELCPESYGLPHVACSATCTACYRDHIVPECMVLELNMQPPCCEELERLIGGVV